VIIQRSQVEWHYVDACSAGVTILKIKFPLGSNTYAC